MTLHQKSLCMLILVTILWGLTFPLIKMASQYVNADTFVAIRFLLAAIALLPFVFGTIFSIPKRRILQGLLLGVLNGVSFISQTIGLKTIDPASSSFITGIGVIIVPFILPLFGLGKPRYYNYACSLLCLLGLYILTGPTLKQDSIGVCWTLLCALFYALFIVYLQKVKPEKNEVFLLAFYQIIGSGGLATVLFLHASPQVILNTTSIIALLFCGIFASSLVLVLQTRYQQFVPPTQVVLVYSLEALFASIFSFLLVHEHLSLRFLFGGVIMVISIILNELQPQFSALTLKKLNA